ncbi:hypothetical protein RV02_GL003411 [Enterococcus gilvus]|nr:hypothetical protein RV02_GL003411 [Enterococcus gilvus]
MCSIVINTISKRGFSFNREFFFILIITYSLDLLYLWDIN